MASACSTQARQALTVLHSGSDPETVAVSHDGRQLFVANEDTAQLTVIDPADGRVLETVKVGGEPEGTGITPDGKRVYVTSEDDGRRVRRRHRHA